MMPIPRECDTDVSRYFLQELKSISHKTNGDAGEILIANRDWTFPGYPTVHLVDGIWENFPDLGRTHSWLVHQFKFVQPLIAYDRLNRSTAGARAALTLAHNWWSKYQFNVGDKSEMAWHDHATAIRLVNLLLLRAHLVSVDVQEDLSQDMLLSHAHLLAKESFHTTENNHGLDQSLALFKASFELGLPEYTDIAVERVRDHISKAFVDDGGHIENSPNYQEFGLNQALRASRVSYSYLGHDRLGLPDTMLAKATLVLAHMILPSGKLPIIGDSPMRVAKSNFGDRKPSTFPAYEYATSSGRDGRPPADTDLVLPTSGWAIFRQHWKPDDFCQAVHIIMKWGHLSSAHRHDDDLSLTVFGFGEQWVSDAGQFKYQEDDPVRIYCRSSRGHSIPQVSAVAAARQLRDYAAPPKILSWELNSEASCVSAETSMFPGFKMKRLVKYDRPTNTIRIQDTCSPDSEESWEWVKRRAGNGLSTYETRFLIPVDKTLRVEPGKGVLIGGKTRTMRIATSMSVKVLLAQVEEPISGWRSEVNGVIEPAYDVTFWTSAEEYDGIFEINWH